MAGGTTTTFAEALQTVLQPAMIKTFSENTPMMNLVGTIPAKSGKGIEWIVNSAGNDSAESFDEGDSAPEAGYQTYISPLIEHNDFQATAKLTGHARARLKGGHFDAAAAEVQGAIKALARVVETTIVADFIDAIDDDTLYGAVNRATYGLDSFVKDASSTVLKIEYMEDCWEALGLDGRDVDFSDFFFFCSGEQDMAYQRAVDGVGGVNLNLNVGAVLDAGRAQSVREFNTKPIVVIPTMTNTYMFGSKKSDLVIEELEGLIISPLGKTDDSENYLITWRGKGFHRDPLRACRIESLTA